MHSYEVYATNRGSGESVHTTLINDHAGVLSGARSIKFCPGFSYASLLCVCDQQGLWRVCAYAQTRLPSFLFRWCDKY